MGIVFTGMGLVTMMFPSAVMRLSFQPHMQSLIFLPGTNGLVMNPVLKLMVQCFGSQAALCGILILSSKFQRRTFKIFGLCMVPYFVFDFYYYQQNMLSLTGALGDLAGNIIFAGCSIVGYLRMK
ncbi:hypothetical protein HDV03_004189 [Kappamyces sp. JEL0829]|nr:hypothetical protein HDV03_004189 [Kappamyces sp. JEL0829]